MGTVQKNKTPHLSIDQTTSPFPFLIHKCSPNKISNRHNLLAAGQMCHYNSKIDSWSIKDMKRKSIVFEKGFAKQNSTLSSKFF